MCSDWYRLLFIYHHHMIFLHYGISLLDGLPYSPTWFRFFKEVWHCDDETAFWLSIEAWKREWDRVRVEETPIQIGDYEFSLQ